MPFRWWFKIQYIDTKYIVFGKNISWNLFYICSAFIKAPNFNANKIRKDITIILYIFKFIEPTIGNSMPILHQMIYVMGPVKSVFLWNMSMIRNKKKIVHSFNSRNLSSALKWSIFWSVGKKNPLEIFVENKLLNGYFGSKIFFHDFLLFIGIDICICLIHAFTFHSTVFLEFDIKSYENSI